MKLHRQDYNDIAVIDMHGDFTAEHTDMFHNAANAAITDGRKGIVLDMSNMTGIDSAGLEQLLWLRDHCLESKCGLKLAGLDEVCRKILEITRLAQEFDRYSELAEAVKSFA